MKPNRDSIDSNSPDIQARQHWMGVLARASSAQLEQAFSTLEEQPRFNHLRSPEVGMTMVRARADARGDQFNLGEMTITRCSIRLHNGPVGHAYVAGRNKRHAELAAVFDALLQDPLTSQIVTQKIIVPLHEGQVDIRQKTAAKTAATKVNFFTMVRGED